MKANLKTIAKYSAIVCVGSLVLTWVGLFAWGFLDSSLAYLLAGLFHYLFWLSIIVLGICGVVWLYKKIKKSISKKN